MRPERRGAPPPTPPPGPGAPGPARGPPPRRAHPPPPLLSVAPPAAPGVLGHLGLGGDLARVSADPPRLIHRDGRDGRTVAASQDNRWYRETFGAPFYGLYRMALQRLLVGAFGLERLHLGCRAEELE